MPVEFKIELEDLKKGMYVSRLDRPWIETSFLLEGKLIESEDDIDSLRKFCKFVYIDTDRGVSFHSNLIITNENSSDNTQQTPPAVIEANQSKLPISQPNQKGIAVKRKAVSLQHDFRQKKSSNQHKSVKSKRHKLEVKIRAQPDVTHKIYGLSSYNGYVEDIVSRRKKNYKDKTVFSTEFKTASVVHENLGGNYQLLLSDLNNGKNLDLKVVEEGISDMANSIIRNPSAMTWVAQIKKLDEYSYSRALGTSVWCATFGRHLGLEKSAIETLALGGLLLDIGKSTLPTELLKLSRKLTSGEYGVMKRHVNFSNKIIAEATWDEIDETRLNDIMKMVAEHHERADASGYPDALENKDISFFGRMAGIVDSFDAMTSERAYKGIDSKSANNAVNELYRLRGSKFQSELVEQFIQTVGVYPTGSLVELNTGEVGVVVSINSLRRLRPTLMILLDEEKKPLETLREVNLTKVSNEVAIANGLPTGAFDINLSELFL